MYRMVKSVGRLGEGTFAEVFGCTTEMGETLAIKVLIADSHVLNSSLVPYISYVQLKGASSTMGKQQS